MSSGSVSVGSVKMLKGPSGASNISDSGSTKSSKFRFLSWSSDTHTVREFVENFPLPRVVRITNCEEVSLINSLGLPPDVDITQPLLLYKKYRPVKVQGKCLKAQKSGKWKEIGPNLIIPDSFQGWFSLLSCDGKECAMMLTSMGQVAAARVPAFLSKFDVPVYKLTDSHEPGGKSVYVRSNMRAGSILRLLGVWADLGGTKSLNSYPKGPFGGSLGGFGGRLVARTLSHANQPSPFQYVQCLSHENEILFIPFSASGVFYPIAPRGGRNPQHVYPLSAIARTHRLPIRVKMVCGASPTNIQDFTGTLQIDSFGTEDVLLGCTLLKEKPTLFELEVDSNDILLSQMTSEDLFTKSNSYQMAITHCHADADSWKSQIRPRASRARLRCGTITSASLTSLTKKSGKNSLLIRSSPQAPSKLSLLFRPSSSSFPFPKDALKRSKSFNVEIQSVSLSLDNTQDVEEETLGHKEDGKQKLSTLFNFMAGKGRKKAEEKFEPRRPIQLKQQQPSPIQHKQLTPPDVLHNHNQNNHNNHKQKIPVLNYNRGNNRLSLCEPRPADVPYGTVLDDVTEEENIYSEISDPLTLKLNLNPIHRLGFNYPRHLHGSNMSSLMKGGGGSDGAFSNGTLSGTFSSSNPSSREEDIYDSVF